MWKTPYDLSWKKAKGFSGDVQKLKREQIIPI